jgi:hypothetical protein
MLRTIDTHPWPHEAATSAAGDRHSVLGGEDFALLQRHCRLQPQSSTQVPLGANPAGWPAPVPGEGTDPFAGLDMTNLAHREIAYEIAAASGLSTAEASDRLGIREADASAWLRQTNKSLPADEAVPDLSNEAWLARPHETRNALDEYVRGVLKSDRGWADKYATLRANLPPDYFAVGRTQWLNRALGAQNAQAADHLIRAIDPYAIDRWVDPATGSSMNSLAISGFPRAERVGFDLSGRRYDLDTADDVMPGRYRDISDDWAQRIIAGNAPVTYPGATSGQSGAGCGAVDPGSLLVRDSASATPSAANLAQTESQPSSTQGVSAYLRNRLDLDGLINGLSRLRNALDDIV